MRTALLAIIFLVVTIGFALVFHRLLEWVTTLVAGLGARLHTLFDMPNQEEKNVWLFALLLGLTKWPTVLLGSATFFLYLLPMAIEEPWMILIRSMLLSVFIFFVAVRLLSVMGGSVMLGQSVYSTIKSLQT